MKQWRIQDFPDGGSHEPLDLRQNPIYVLFGKIFAENCMKMKEFGPRGGSAPLAPPLDRPMRKSWFFFRYKRMVSPVAPVL